MSNEFDGINSITVDLFQRSTRANQSRRSLKKIKSAKIDRSNLIFLHISGKTVRNIQNIHFFEGIVSFLRAIWSFQRSTRALRSRSIFLKDQREWFDHGWSFLKDQRERFNHGQYFFKIDKIERSKNQKIEYQTLGVRVLFLAHCQVVDNSCTWLKRQCYKIFWHFLISWNAPS